MTSHCCGCVTSISDYLKDHTRARDQSALLLMCALQKQHSDECALFKADDNQALENGSTFIEIGKSLSRRVIVPVINVTKQGPCSLSVRL